MAFSSGNHFLIDTTTFGNKSAGFLTLSILSKSSCFEVLTMLEAEIDSTETIDVATQANIKNQVRC